MPFGRGMLLAGDIAAGCALHELLQESCGGAGIRHAVKLLFCAAHCPSSKSAQGLSYAY